jgi:radical SAM superfamily enzyme YgiQ (UPF0313 family)
MKILLVNPWEGEIFPPPSIGYVAAAARQNTNAEVVCANMDSAIRLLKSTSYDIVGVSFHSFSVRNARKIRAAVKGDSFLTCGGHHPSSSIGNQLLSIGYDQVVIGEGEGAISEIIAGNRSRVITVTNPYSIDKIPFPQYEGLDFQRENGYPIISSRGCPFSCGFCASAQFWGHRWHPRSPSNVIEEIEYRIKNNRMRKWMFEDDNFTLNTARARTICEMIEKDIFPKYGRMEWQCASRAESLMDEDLVESMVRAGCVKCWLGIESLSQDTLERFCKNTTVDRMSNGINTASRMGLNTHSQFIAGLPGDTREDIIVTVENMKNIRMGSWGCNVPWILPDTMIYSCAKKCGFNDNSYLEGGFITYTYEQSISTLMAWEKAIRTLNTEGI